MQHRASTSQPTNGRAPSTGRGRWAVLTLAVLAGLLSGCGGGSKYPAFLPKSSLNVKSDSVLTGTTANPALTVEGDPVEVVTPHWKVLVNVTGPQVPGEGLPVVQPATYCTWTIQFSHATGNVPISMANFRPIDASGHTYTLSLPAGQDPPPPTLHPGQTLSFQVRDYEPSGEGLMRWAPDGNNIVAKWDYEVEND